MTTINAHLKFTRMELIYHRNVNDKRSEAGGIKENVQLDLPVFHFLRRPWNAVLGPSL